MNKVICTFIVIVFILTGCSTDSEPISDNTSIPKETVKQETNKQPIIMPQTMPNDFNFKVSYGYGEVRKNVIDTYTGTVKKDLIAKGTATADLSFTSEELRIIYYKMKNINIMGEKQLIADSGCGRIPSNTDTWQVTVNGETATLTWTDNACSITKDAQQLLELRQYIQHIVALKESYKALPEAEGGYD